MNFTQPIIGRQFNQVEFFQNGKSIALMKRDGDKYVYEYFEQDIQTIYMPDGKVKTFKSARGFSRDHD